MTLKKKKIRDTLMCQEQRSTRVLQILGELNMTVQEKIQKKAEGYK